MADNIKAPDHYVDGREYEPKDVIRDWGLNFNLGSAVKYISRAGRKGDKLEDLQKAKQFLEFEIEELEKANKSPEWLEKLLERQVDSVLNGELSVTYFVEPYRKVIIGRIVQKIDSDELDCFDIPGELCCGYQDIRDAITRQALRNVGEKEKSDIGMTCKEAAEIGDAIAKGLEDGIKEAKEKYDEAEENLAAIEQKISWYVNGIFGQWYYYQNIPDGYKTRVIDKIAKEVLDNQCDVTMNMLTIELQDMVIDRIVEMIDNDELSSMDIPTDLYMECARIRAAISNWIYRKTMDGVRKYAEDTEDTVSINFEFEVDQEIDTDTVNVHVHII